MEQYLGSEIHKKAVSKGGQIMALRQKEEAEKRIVEYNKNPKKCLQCNNPIFHKIGKLNTTLCRKFCDSTCSALYSNSHRKYKPSEDKKTKEIYCPDCGEKIIVDFRANSKTTRCTTCRNIRNKSYNHKPKEFHSKKPFVYPKEPYKVYCVSCQKEIITWNPDRNFCASCIGKQGGSKGGRASAAKQAQTRRSKNEIYFAELCKEKFQNVKTNEPIFNGWDADVILPDQKIAILWNGKWHYQKITAKHSVKQVQNRDQIKQKEIEKAGYKIYVVKDLGKYNKDFVKEEFKKFLVIF